MAERRARAAEPILAIEDLHVYYGQAHALQGVSLRLDAGALAVVGRNGMGKTTLCNAIMGLVPAARGRVRLRGRDLLGLPAHAIVQAGIGYVPQGRRVWPSLTVDEHLRLAARRTRGAWTVARVYDAFPRLAERRGNGGAQLSGGEQQMLAIGRALLSNPRLLVMDEPTEGLAPTIVEQVEDILRDIVADGETAVLLVEQNIGVATTAAAHAAIMVNGRIARTLPAAELARDHRVQQRLLGVGHAEDDEELEAPPAEAPAAIYRVRRSEAEEDLIAPPLAAGQAAPAPVTRWSHSNPLAGPSQPRRASTGPPATAALASQPEGRSPAAVQIPVGAAVGRVAYIAGTFDTKGRELNFLKTCLEKLGLRTTTVDLSTSGSPSAATVGPAEIARHHPRGSSAVFTGDRGSAVAAMAEAFERFIASRRDLGGIIAAGGSGATALATPAMRRLAVGVPKVMVSTVASGDVKRYVGPSDICMIHSVTDVAGINRISEQVLANAAHALAGMIAHRVTKPRAAKPALGLTMFGVTTPCVQAVVRALEAEYDCLVFHATGTGGQSMEKLADSGLLAGIIDVSTTEIADLLMGGVMSAGEDRLGAAIRTRLPYVGSCGALDMVNFGPRDTVPERYRGRTLYQHNPQVTLMRTTAEENAAIGRWIAAKLNQCQGPMRFLLPEGGLSLLDAPGKPFHDPAADRALFAALEHDFRPSTTRRLVRLPYNVNDPPFAAALVGAFREIAGAGGARRAAG